MRFEQLYRVYAFGEGHTREGQIIWIDYVDSGEDETNRRRADAIDDILREDYGDDVYLFADGSRQEILECAVPMQSLPGARHAHQRTVARRVVEELDGYVETAN